MGRTLLMALAAIVLVAAGCAPPGPRAASSGPAAAGPPSAASAVATAQVTIYAPSTTTSVPIILAARQLSAQAGATESAVLTIFTNHSQANTLFLRGDADILVTGLSVGVEFFRNGAPVQVVNCNVSGLTYLVTYGRQVSGFADLRGDSLYLPFEGSPIEEVTRFFAEREGLAWKQDIMPVYASSDSALTLLTQGKIAAVALPEPYVSLAEHQAQPGQVHVSLGYRERWDSLTGSTGGYPQVCAFVSKPWAGEHGATIARFNEEVAKAVEAVQRDPDAAAREVEGALGFTREILSSALARTDFALHDADQMAQEIRRYYQTVGKPLDPSYDSFFYH